MKEFFYKIFVLNYSVFSTSSFLLKIVNCEALLSLRDWNKSGFQSKNIFFPIRLILTADFERVSIVCALAGATDKNTKRCFRPVIEFTFYSYAIQEKFTRQAVNFSIILTEATLRFLLHDCHDWLLNFPIWPVRLQMFVIGQVKSDSLDMKQPIKP